MTSLSQTDILAILALLDLRDPGHMVDLDVLVNLTDDSIDHDTYTTKSSETATTGMNEILPAGDLSPLHYSAEAEANVITEDCKTSSPESEFWEEYLADFLEESLSPVQMSTNGTISDNSISEGDLEGNENVSGSNCGEAYIYDPLDEDWITNGTLYHDLEAQSNVGIDEPFVGNSITSETHLFANSPESGMDWVDWSKLMDDQLSNEKKLKRRENELRRKANNSAQTCRCQPTRTAAGLSRKRIKKYSWKVGSYRDFQQSLIVKLKVTLKPVDLVL